MDRSKLSVFARLRSYVYLRIGSVLQTPCSLCRLCYSCSVDSSFLPNTPASLFLVVSTLDLLPEVLKAVIKAACVAYPVRSHCSVSEHQLLGL